MMDKNTESNALVQKLRGELLQRETELSILTSVQLGLASRLDVQGIYDLVGDRIRDIFEPDVVMLSTYDPLTNTVEHRYAIEAGERIYAPGHLPPGGFRSQIIQNRKPLLENVNVGELAARLGQPTIPGTVTPKSWLGVPMLVGDQVTGILSLQSITHENAFTENDKLILQALAASMSVALDNARLWEQEHIFRQALEREFEIGRNIQAGFLPESIPQPKGWEIGVFLKSASEVAGDFYDVFKLPGGKVGLVIADVCDKGLGAALFMTLVRSLLRVSANIDQYTREKAVSRVSTGQLLQRTVMLTNNYISEMHGKSGMFATVFIGILDVRSGSLQYINCGHIPPMVISEGNLKKTLRLTGPALGAIPDPVYRSEAIHLKHGDLLFAFTDGLSDSTNLTGEYFDIQRLMPLFRRDQSLAELCPAIHELIESFTVGMKQFDDIAMLAVKRAS